jgi:hypothetical protein
VVSAVAIAFATSPAKASDDVYLSISASNSSAVLGIAEASSSAQSAHPFHGNSALQAIVIHGGHADEAPRRMKLYVNRDVEFDCVEAAVATHTLHMPSAMSDEAEFPLSLAKFNNHWDTNIEQWCNDVLKRKPVHLRQRGDKWTTNNNNVMIWRLMMLFREVVNQELDMMELNNFNEHFEIAH